MTKKSSNPWDAVSLSNYSAELLNSQKWFETANEIMAAMAVLEPYVLAWWQSMREWSRGNMMFREYSFSALYMMLAGLAIENLSKGDAIHRLTPEERAQIKRSGRLPRELETHDLPKLVTRTGLSIDTNEEELLQRLKRAVLWFGRYPVPKYYSGRDEARLKDGKTCSSSWTGSADTWRINLLVKRLRDHIGARESYRVSADR